MGRLLGPTAHRHRAPRHRPGRLTARELCAPT
jgi:hypothetical protein